MTEQPKERSCCANFLQVRPGRAFLLRFLCIPAPFKSFWGDLVKFPSFSHSNLTIKLECRALILHLSRKGNICTIILQKGIK